MANKLVITVKKFGHIVSFVGAKNLLESMGRLVTCLHGSFGFKKIEEIIHIYKETSERTDELFQSVYTEAVSLGNDFGHNHAESR